MKQVDTEIVTLQTLSLSMIFKRSGNGFALAYFGKSVAASGDVVNLAIPRENFFSQLRDTIGDICPTFGGDAPIGMEAYGSLCVTHGDGTTSTVLRVEGVREETDTRENVRHIVFEMRDAAFNFKVAKHFVAYADCDVFETWTTLHNEEDSAVSISKMDSLSISLRGLGKGVTVHSLASHWGAEAKLCETALATGQTLSLGSHSGVRGAWENNQGFMVSIGGKSTETNGVVFGGALAWSGAWESRVTRTHAESLLISAGVSNCAGPYILDAGKSITLPKFIFTYSAFGRGAVSRNLHDWARSYSLPHGRELRPVLLNSWEGAYFNFSEKTLVDMMDGVKGLGGEMFVVDDGWFGRGKFARNTDKVGLGDWFWNFDKLPHGLKYLADEATARGLRFGLWFEPEMANTDSEIVTSHPDWILREKNRCLRTGRGGTQVVLDMCNPAVRDEIFRRIDDLLKSTPMLSYIKWDANSDIVNAGSPYLPVTRQANLWFDYTNGVYELFARLRKAHPHIMFQACASGGGHADYGFLGFADEIWGSDDTDARQRIFIQWGEMQFIPANAVACHVTAVPNHQTGRVTPLKYRFDVAMSGRLGFELHPANMSADEINFAKNAVLTYKRIRPVVQQGDMYRLASPYDNGYASLMYVDKAKEHAVFFVYGLNRNIYADQIPPIQLFGLDSAKRYMVNEVNTVENNCHTAISGKEIGGDALMSIGVPVMLGVEYDSAVFELTVVK